MADTVEAVLGAVEVDGGPEALLQVATRLGLVHRLITPEMSKSYSLSLV
jgi:dsRNA-specific ribonuclease